MLSLCQFLSSLKPELIVCARSYVAAWSAGKRLGLRICHHNTSLYQYVDLAFNSQMV